MSKFGLSPEREMALRRAMYTLKIFEKDIREQFVRGSGSGGQKINKTSVCVVLKHIPSGIEIREQTYRQQGRNRFQARERLCRKLERLQNQEKQAQRDQKEKKRRQIRAKTRSRSQKQKILDSKRVRSKLKQLRRKPQED